MIRAYQLGDAAIEAAITNHAAAHLPGFVPLRPEDIEWESRNPRDFAPHLRFIAEHDGHPVGICQAHPCGRISLPWCLPGYEGYASPLFQHTLHALYHSGVRRIFAACHAKWTDQHAYLEAFGLPKVRDMINYLLPIRDVPTLVGSKANRPIRLLERSDLPEVERILPQALRLSGHALERYLFLNPMFPAESLFALCARQGNLLGVGIFLQDEQWPQPRQTDPNQAHFRLGAFGNEGIPAMGVNGLFSCLIRTDRDAVPIGLDLIAQALERLDGEEDESPQELAAQVPSDVPHLAQFYERYFQRQGQFPVFERILS